jgi:hypothetical protein
MKERVFIHTIPVSSPKQRIAFQMKLPPNARRITKMHVSFIGRLATQPVWGGAFSFYVRAFRIGEIGLSVAGTTNQFFRGLVQSTDQNAAFLDLPSRLWAAIGSGGLAKLNYFPGPLFRVAKPDPLDIPLTNTLVEGWFQDIFYDVEAPLMDLAVFYDIKVYLWAEIDDIVKPKTIKPDLDCKTSAGNTVVEVNSLVIAAVQT